MQEIAHMVSHKHLVQSHIYVTVASEDDEGSAKPALDKISGAHSRVTFNYPKTLLPGTQTPHRLRTFESASGISVPVFYEEKKNPTDIYTITQQTLYPKKKWCFSNYLNNHSKLCRRGISYLVKGKMMPSIIKS